MQGVTFIFLILAALVIWLLGLTFYIYKTSDSYKRVISGLKQGDLASVINSLIERIDKFDRIIHGIKAGLDEERLKSVGYVQKVGVLRYNPFSDTGGDQSFILSILDGKNDGIVLTSLHSRGITRWYAKNIKDGKCLDYELSKEELKAINSAQKIYLNKVVSKT